MKQHYKDLMSIEDFEERDVVMWVDNLIHSACLSSDEKTFCENLNCDDQEEEILDMMIGLLLDSQPDRIRMGLNYSQSDITCSFNELT